MSSITYITTSWDDGYPLDMRVGELLAKYGLKGTFYVPEHAERATLTKANVRELASNFEIGAHTINHVVLTEASDAQSRLEITNCRRWIEDNTGQSCLLFCPPKGRFRRRHLALVRQAGYLGLRSAEWFSLDFPRAQFGLLLMPTTLQAYPHGFVSFGQNLIKRAALGNLWRFIVHGSTARWPVLARSFLLHALERGGVFHLWGHSWELQERAQWQRLEEVLRLLGSFTNQAPALTNGQICLLASDEARSGSHLRNRLLQ